MLATYENGYYLHAETSLIYPGMNFVFNVMAQRTDNSTYSFILNCTGTQMTFYVAVLFQEHFGLE